jgi:hypothetical protein
MNNTGECAGEIRARQMGVQDIWALFPQDPSDPIEEERIVPAISL